MQGERQLWTNIRSRLDQAYQYDVVWEEAIQVFDGRIRKKFFAPVQLIINDNRKKGEGFAIVTVQCALIEMFAAFREGKIFNHLKNAASPSYEYNKSKQMFTGLLRNAAVFKDHFWTLDEKGKTTIDSPYHAGEFYADVRCGLMHEARTKNSWIISDPKTLKPETDRQFIVSEGGKIKIYRTVLHYRLLEYMAVYLQDLRQDGAAGNLLRKHFARKLDNLFDFTPDAKFDWWN